jgi:F-type H+-transporting ATPase subunit a
VTETPKKRAWGRWVVLALILGSYLAAYIFNILPVQPHVQLPAEPVPPITVILAVSAGLAILLTILVRRWEGLLLAAWFGVLASLPLFFGFIWTNTLTAMVLADLVLVLLGFGVYRAVRSGSLVPRGISGAVEALLEVLYNMGEGTAGRWIKFIFPWFATITLLVLVANWTELVPFVDSVGVIEHAEEGAHGFAVRDLGWAQIIVQNQTPAEEAGQIEGESFVLVPFVRVVSTDLNFTVALALIAVVMVQVIGFKSQGLNYLWKFWNTGTLFNKPFFGVIDFGVGLLELVSEFSKVLSFAFRLFGNIFAGSVLLFVIGTLVPVFAQSLFLMLEFFVGAIQAIVFGLLTMTFMSQATQGHGEHHEHQEDTPIQAAVSSPEI